MGWSLGDLADGFKRETQAKVETGVNGAKAQAQQQVTQQVTGAVTGFLGKITGAVSDAVSDPKGTAERMARDAVKNPVGTAVKVAVPGAAIADAVVPDDVKRQAGAAAGHALEDAKKAGGEAYDAAKKAGGAAVDAAKDVGGGIWDKMKQGGKFLQEHLPEVPEGQQPQQNSSPFGMETGQLVDAKPSALFASNGDSFANPVEAPTADSNVEFKPSIPGGPGGLA